MDIRILTIEEIKSERYRANAKVVGKKKNMQEKVSSGGKGKEKERVK